MAITYPDASAILASDLLISIHPRAYTDYQGTAEQLRAEGLIPDGFKWPIGDRRISYEVGKFSYWMRRCRPDGIKGPKSIWVNGDYWFLRRELASQGRDGYRAADIYKKTKELAEIIRRGTHEWSRIANASWEARCDDKYMAFRNLLTGEPKRGRGRPSKAGVQSNAAPE